MAKTVRIISPLLLLGYVLAFPLGAQAEGLKRGTMEEACTSKSKPLTDLCALVKREFEDMQEGFVQLDERIYLVAVTNTGRVSQGIYVANIATGKMAMFGGYGAPTFGSSFTDVNGITYLRLSYLVPMHRGEYGGGEYLLHIRTNPVTGRKYIIEQPIRETSQFSEEVGKADKTVVYGNVPDPMKPRVLGKDFVSRILAAHRYALQTHKAERAGKPTRGQPFSILEKAGVWAMVDQKPPGMPLPQYVSVMNDYAFFAYQYGEGRTDLAIEILLKIIGLAPNRTPAYLNIADALYYAVKYQSIPLGDEAVTLLNSAAKKYRAISESKKSLQ